VDDAVAEKTAIYMHLDGCAAPFSELVSVPVRQGQALLPVGENGCTGACVHLHFHVHDGDLQFGIFVSQPFEMSDKSSFPQSENTEACESANIDCVHEGPSDNAGVAYVGVNPDVTNTSVGNAYDAAGGWWIVGASYRSTIEMSDEWGGVCRNTTTRFVHTCTSSYGTLTSQNYIDILGVRHSVYLSPASTGHVEGQIQGALSNLYAGGSRISAVMGAATGPESGNVQQFQGGYIQRVNGLNGIRIEAYTCSGLGCLLFAVLRYSALGIFCPTVNADPVVNSLDLGLISAAFGTSNLNYDLNVNGSVNSVDLGLASARFGFPPCPADVEPD